MKIGIQGGKGSYHEQAAQHYGQLQGSTLVYQPTFKQVFAGLEAGDYDRALVAIANNAVGFIHEPYSHLVLDGGRQFSICGETYVRVEHHLLGLPGATLTGIRQVHSQAPALGQCTAFLQDQLDGREVVEESDTALSAQRIAEWADPAKAAIASKRAGELYGLQSLAANIQDDPDNITRFLLVARADESLGISQANKTTCLLDTGQQPGALVTALLPFREAGVNISSLQSLFVPNSPFHMQFFLEFDAAATDPRTQRIQDWLHGLGCTMTMLGSYASQQVPILKI